MNGERENLGRANSKLAATIASMNEFGRKKTGRREGTEKRGNAYRLCSVDFSFFFLRICR